MIRWAVVGRYPQEQANLLHPRMAFYSVFWPANNGIEFGKTWLCNTPKTAYVGKLERMAVDSKSTITKDGPVMLREKRRGTSANVHA